MAAPKSQYKVEEKPMRLPIPTAMGDIEKVMGMAAMVNDTSEGKSNHWSRSSVKLAAKRSVTNNTIACVPPSLPASNVEAAAFPMG